MTDLSQFKVTKTEDQEKIEWLEILSIRNRMLSISDWTQLPDCGLDTNNIEQWKHWRNDVRNVSRKTVASKDDAKTQLEQLDKITPKVIHAIYSDNINDVKQKLINLLRAKYTQIVNNKLMCFDQQTFGDKFNEAIDFLSNETNDLTVYPILNTLATLRNVSVSDVATHLINEKKTYIKNVCLAETFFHEFSHKINSATSIKKLFTIEKNINGYRY